MNRRDTVFIALFINIGLLSLLFMLAVKTDPIAHAIHEEESQYVAIAETKPEKFSYRKSYLPVTEEQSENRVAVSTYQTTTPQILVKEDETDQLIQKELLKEQERKYTAKVEEEVDERMDRDSYIEITVKRGDSLDRIARANGTTITKLKKINRLTTDHLDIGQILRVPIVDDLVVGRQEKDSKKQQDSPLVQMLSKDPQFYTVQRGDNPWKLAKKFRVDFEDLLKMNDLDEDRARNLKIGDKIRVK